MAFRELTPELASQLLDAWGPPRHLEVREPRLPALTAREVYLLEWKEAIRYNQARDQYWRQKARRARP